MKNWILMATILAAAPACAQDEPRPAAAVQVDVRTGGAPEPASPVKPVRPSEQLVSPPVATATPNDPPGGTASIETVEKPIVCYSARETGDRVARLRLQNPLLAMQAHAKRLRAEPLRTRLCRSAGRMIYELSLIRRDGKVHVVYLNAQTGKPMAAPRN